MFHLNGETWLVYLVSPGHPTLMRSDGSVSLGTCDDTTKTIYIDKSLSCAMVRKVLAHEVAHAAMFSYNIDLDYMQEELFAMLIDTYGQEIISLTNYVTDQIKNRGFC